MEIIKIILAGIVASTLMLGVIVITRKAGNSVTELMTLIGSFVTQTESNFFISGLGVHYFLGVFFSCIYALALKMAPIETFGEVLILCSFIGLLHGLVVGLSTVALTDTDNPLRRFRQTGFQIVLSHLASHAFYGFSFGFILGLEGSQISRVRENVLIEIGQIMGYSVVFTLLLGAPFLIVALSFLPWLNHQNGLKQEKAQSSDNRPDHGVDNSLDNKVATLGSKKEIFKKAS